MIFPLDSCATRCLSRSFQTCQREMEKLAKPHPHLGSTPLVGQAGGHGCKRHGASWLKILCQLLAQARQCGALILKDSGPSARQPGWAPERDRDTSPRGAEGTAARSSSPGLGSPGPGSCQKLGLGSSWRLGWCRAQAWQLQQMVAHAPQSLPPPREANMPDTGKSCWQEGAFFPTLCRPQPKRKQRGFSKVSWGPECRGGVGNGVVPNVSQSEPRTHPLPTANVKFLSQQRVELKIITS